MSVVTLQQGQQHWGEVWTLLPNMVCPSGLPRTIGRALSLRLSHLCNVHADTYFWSGQSLQWPCRVPTLHFPNYMKGGSFQNTENCSFWLQTSFGNRSSNFDYPVNDSIHVDHCTLLFELIYCVITKCIELDYNDENIFWGHSLAVRNHNLVPIF